MYKNVSTYLLTYFKSIQQQKHNLKGPTSASVKQYSDIHPVVQMSKAAFLENTQ